MGESVDEASADAAAKPKPTILVPPRASMEFLAGSGPGFSPGPMTLVSNLFPENSPFSFSQLLAGAMASPMAANSKGLDLGKEGKIREVGAGNKVNRPVAVAPLQVPMENLSSLFVAPPGLSPGFLNSPGFLSPLQSPFGMSHQQALAHVTAQAVFSQSFKQMQADLHNPADTPPNNPSATPNEPESSKLESSEASQLEKRQNQISGDKPANDGYNWRKYGQKHVKASECPRSYYKCTHINCPVKKKVERSPDGRVSEITYKGQHNHDPPQPQKRGKDSSALDKVASSQSKPVLERNGVNEPMIVQSEPGIADVPSAEHHTAVSSQYDDGKSAAIVVDKGDIEEPVAKRRSIDMGTSNPATTHQTITESKIVLQTRSEVDLLDDGFKWRKYGQKVVKGNPYPRSYYRCTFQGCNVRKHVERASADPKAVITTYEGKHNHDAPVGRHGNNSNNSHQLKTAQKTGPRNNNDGTGELEKRNKDQIPMTLQLKEDQIAA